MWNNNFSNNSCIWLILLILIFFNNSSSNPTDIGNYFKYASSNLNTNNFLNRTI